MYKSKSKPIDWFLLFLTSFSIPFQEDIPTIAGASFSFLLFGLVVFRLILRYNEIGKFLKNLGKIILVILIFLTFITFLESMYSHSDYQVVIQITLMFLGAICIGLLVTDLHALQALVYGFIIASLVMSFFFIQAGGVNTIFYGSVASFNEADYLRTNFSKGLKTQQNLNTIAYFSSVSFLYVVVAFLFTKSKLKRFIFVGIACITFITILMTLSRSGLINTLLIAFGLAYYFKVPIKKMIVISGVAIILFVSYAPDVFLARFQYVKELSDKGIKEGRARVYETAWKHLDEIIFQGVGAGNYYKNWGYHTDFEKNGRVSGTHNVYLQLLFNWGIGALFLYLILIRWFYSYLPTRKVLTVESVTIVLFFSFGLVLTLVNHTMYDKEYSISFGLAISNYLWANFKQKNMDKIFKWSTLALNF